MRKLALIILALLAALACAAALAEEGDFRFIEYDDGTAVLQHYYGTEEVVTFPAEHNGHRVIAVAPMVLFDADTRAAGIRKVVIEPGIEEISTDCFRFCEGLEEVEIPGSVRTIGHQAFCDCPNLRSVTLGEGVERIESTAFWGCASLQSIVIPDSVNYIGGSAFGNSGLTDIQIGNQYVETDGNPMDNSPWLSAQQDKEWIILGSMLLGYNGSSRDLIIPSGIQSIASGIIPNTGAPDAINSIAFGPDVRFLAGSAFSNCQNIEQISGGENVENVGYNCFYDQVNGRFANADGETIIGKVLARYSGDASQYEVPEGIVAISERAFNSCGTLERVHLPGSLKRIGSLAFLECENLLSANLPAGLERIDENPFEYCGIGVHGGLISDSERFVVTGDVLYDVEQEKVVSFLNTEASTIVVPAGTREVGRSAYAYCIYVQTLTIPEGVRKIDDRAFSQQMHIDSLVIPDSVYIMGHEAFGNCQALEYVEIGSGISEIGNYTPFSECKAIREAVVGPNVVWMNLASFYSDELTIYGAAGSFAQRHAATHNPPYQFAATMESDAASAIRQPRNGYERSEDSYVHGGGFRFYVAPYMEQVSNDDGTMICWCEYGESTAYMKFSITYLGVSYDEYEGSRNYAMENAQQMIDLYAIDPGDAVLIPVPIVDVNVRVPGYRGYFRCNFDNDAGTTSRALVTLNGFYNEATGYLMEVVAVQTENCQYDYSGDFEKVMQSISFDGEQKNYSEEVWNLVDQYYNCYQQLKTRLQNGGSFDDTETMEQAMQLASLYNQVHSVSTVLLDEQTSYYYEQTLNNMEGDALLSSVLQLLQKSRQ